MKQMARTVSFSPPQFMRSFLISLLITLGLLAGLTAETIDFRPHWDRARPLANPDKGWYHHYFDNGVQKYLAKKDEDVLQITGMDHLYLRLSWHYLEPQEGQFNWDIIDKVIAHWTKRGLGISFRLTCKETGHSPIEQQWATPPWVAAAGAKGGFWRNGKPSDSKNGRWEPLYNDPVFLKKLDSFLAAFAARYDHQPWARYLDIGTIGDWGEGHSSDSHQKVSVETRLEHLKMHRRHFKNLQLVVTDDYVYDSRNKDQIEELHNYVIENGFTYRDDSILVHSLKWSPETFSVSRPDFFRDVYRERPTILEAGHLNNVLRSQYWIGEKGRGLREKAKMEGPEFLEGAIRTLRATYIGYHGDANHFWKLDGNPGVANQLLNLCGYWYFPEKATFPTETISSQSLLPITITWQNHGVAPAYQDYQIHFALHHPDHTHCVALSAQNKRWLPLNDPDHPAKATAQTYKLPLPADLPLGTYKLSAKLTTKDSQPVQVGLKKEKIDQFGYFTLGSVTIK